MEDKRFISIVNDTATFGIKPNSIVIDLATNKEAVTIGKTWNIDTIETDLEWIDIYEEDYDGRYIVDDEDGVTVLTNYLVIDFGEAMINQKTLINEGVCSILIDRHKLKFYNKETKSWLKIK